MGPFPRPATVRTAGPEEAGGSGGRGGGDGICVGRRTGFSVCGGQECAFDKGFRGEFTEMRADSFSDVSGGGENGGGGITTLRGSDGGREALPARRDSSVGRTSLD